MKLAFIKTKLYSQRDYIDLFAVASTFCALNFSQHKILHVYLEVTPHIWGWPGTPLPFPISPFLKEVYTECLS